MKKTLKVLLATAVLGMGLGLTACSSEPAENPVLKMGIMQGKSEIPVIIAEEMGYFEEAGLDVEITSFQGPNYRDAAVQAGEVDGVITDIMTVLNYTQSGFPMTMTSDMNEDFKLIAGAGVEVKEPKDFNGKSIVVAPNYLTHYVMDVIAQREGITYELEAIPQIPMRLEALRNGLVGGAVLGEPQASMLTADGVTIIADAETDYGVEIGAIAFRKEFVESNEEAMEKFYVAYNKAIDYLNETDAAAYIDVVEKYGIAPTIAPYLATPEGEFEYAKTFSKEQFDNVLAWTKEKGLIEGDYVFEEMTNFKFFK